MTTNHYTEVVPDDYMEVAEEDGFLHEYFAGPVDEWECSACACPVGMTVNDSADSSYLSWANAYRDDNDSLYCEDCIPEDADITKGASK